jgi:hypothetical protein
MRATWNSSVHASRGRAIAIARCACARRSAHADEAMKRARFR